jgi:hypothetical protein
VIRPALEQNALPFFQILNVGVQLEQNDGHNCGLYCALWARQLLGRSDPEITTSSGNSDSLPLEADQAGSEEEDASWQVALPRWNQTHMKLLRLRWQRRLDAAWLSPDPNLYFQSVLT